MAVGVPPPIKAAAPWDGVPRSIRRSSLVEEEVTTSKLFRSTGNISRTPENIYEFRK
jgi:hypothetical protein